MKTLAALIVILLPLTSLGQSDGWKYFYHKENVSSNFFDAAKYEIDSVKFFWKKKGDTITYWTISTSTPYEKKEFKKIEKQKDFGKYIQRGLTLSDGRITVHKLRPPNFLLRNDSLFQWRELYKITEDSISILKSRYDQAKTPKEREGLTNLLKLNTTHGFAFIFSPSLFSSGIGEHVIQDKKTRCPTSVTLKDYWVIDNLNYYYINFSDNCGFWGHEWSFIITGNFDIITFGGYSSQEAKLLTKEKSQLNKLIKTTWND